MTIHVKGMLYGVLFAEIPGRLAFPRHDAAALSMIGNHAAATLLISEVMANDAVADPPRVGARLPKESFRVVHHTVDDSVLIDNDYVIRDVAGRLLVYLLERYLVEGRAEFSNREIRLAAELRLPDFKNNLEARLLLLRQRLERNAARCAWSAWVGSLSVFR
ncbi:hypothetical protein [Paracoccus sediminilitoris]|uniref:hypothetical protein n=1 Tax=Paracoccus sediminilitoris TaxID=2202419 RepID=UPI000DB9BBEA|nr:hypothetical protein [Paracoccus sediminilitoris]